MWPVTERLLQTVTSAARDTGFSPMGSKLPETTIVILAWTTSSPRWLGNWLARRATWLFAGINDALGLGASLARRLDADRGRSDGLGDGRGIIARIEHGEVVGSWSPTLLGHALTWREGLGDILADCGPAP